MEWHTVLFYLTVLLGSGCFLAHLVFAQESSLETPREKEEARKKERARKKTQAEDLKHVRGMSRIAQARRLDRRLQRSLNSKNITRSDLISAISNSRDINTFSNSIAWSDTTEIETRIVTEMERRINEDPQIKNLDELDHRLVHLDETGRLFHVFKPDSIRLPFRAYIDVVNPTPNHDGSFDRHYIGVPVEMKTSKEAVAWTYGFSEDGYNIEKRT